MARLPDEQWLHLAKRLPVGGTSRHHHLRENRPNLVVGHDEDRYWAYCQSCKEGGVVKKDHVLITGQRAPAESTRLDLPRDRVHLLKCDSFTQQALAQLLASKSMDCMYMPELWFSEQRKRLLVNTGQGWLGRDTTGKSQQKWLSYDGALYLHCVRGSESPAVVVEDPFSFFKIVWATRHTALSVYCALGTDVRPSLLLELTKHTGVTFYYDGDSAGYRGAAKGAARVRAMGTPAVANCAPDGFDPKDQTIAEIRRHLDVSFER